jgi:hypothetical protein
MSLKTKGFSRETEAFCLFGGGESRTLVLSKLHKNDYMLSVLFVLQALMKNTGQTKLKAFYFISSQNPKNGADLGPYQVDNDSSKALGPTLDYREILAVKLQLLCKRR